MANKGFLYKIDPEDAAEKCYFEALSKAKTSDFRGLAYSLVDENTLYAEAFTLAEAAITWLESLESNYSKFELKSKLIGKTEEEKFLNFCKSKNWKTKKTAKDIIARDGSKFKAKFELSSNNVYMPLSENEDLARMQILNQFEVI